MGRLLLPALVHPIEATDEELLRLEHFTFMRFRAARSFELTIRSPGAGIAQRCVVMRPDEPVLFEFNTVLDPIPVKAVAPADDVDYFTLLAA